jgi:hypothetical protein
VDVLKRVQDLLLVWNVDTRDTWHCVAPDSAAQPWTCLCFGSALQITRTLPLRRMT